MAVLWARRALVADGWRDNVRVEIGVDGRIASVEIDAAPQGQRLATLLPAPSNSHSHAFQRAMAGMTERRGPPGEPDSFWTWRRTMFAFLDHLSPDDVEAITAFAQMEMLEAGFGAVAEFHYLHHRPGRAPYDDLAEMSGRIAAAAALTGIGLTLLPVLYQQGGVDGRPLSPGQIRFGNDPERFAMLFEGAANALKALPPDTGLGVAPHSLRAVTPKGLAAAISLRPDGPIHIHAAEQVAEVEEVVAGLGARPVEWLIAKHDIDARWCLIHATQMQPEETLALAASGAVAGLCPLTEASLGDGIFDGMRYLEAGGRFGFGTDSNISISLASEMRALEYSQRLATKGRAVMADAARSTGRLLFEQALASGAQALARDCGSIATGKLADLMALGDDDSGIALARGDEILDAWIFATVASPVTDVWSAGRHVVTGGSHIAREAIARRYRATVAALRGRL